MLLYIIVINTDIYLQRTLRSGIMLYYSLLYPIFFSIMPSTDAITERKNPFLRRSKQ